MTRSASAEAVIAQTRRAYPTIAGNEDYSAVITERHRARLSAAIDEARSAGATVLTHGDTGNDPAKIAPTVVLGAKPDSMLMREEIFGPVLPVVGYRDLDDAIAIMNGKDRPLALYCFSNERRTHERILASVTLGRSHPQRHPASHRQDGLPFGGIGPSGMGAYHGREGFRRFSHARAVHRIGPVNVFEQLGPPWSTLSRRMGTLLSR